MTLLWLIPLLVLIFLFGVSYYFSRLIIYPMNQTYESALESAIEDGFLAENQWEEMAKEPFIIRSPFGYDLHGYFLPNGTANRTVIVSHGITSNLIKSYKYAQVFLNLDFNALIYDHRNHGRSGGENTTFGYYEADDLRKVIDWLQEQKPGTEMIGIHGESLGAAIGLLAASKDDRVAFMVADCGYANFYDQVADRAKVEYHLPAFPLVPLAFLWARLFTGMKVNQVVPEQAIIRIDAPVLIIHGDKDAYIDPSHAHRLAQADPENPRPCWFAPDADHAESLVKNKAQYHAQVKKFLLDHQLITSDE